MSEIYTKYHLDIECAESDVSKVRMWLKCFDDIRKFAGKMEHEYGLDVLEGKPGHMLIVMPIQHDLVLAHVEQKSGLISRKCCFEDINSISAVACNESLKDLKRANIGFEKTESDRYLAKIMGKYLGKLRAEEYTGTYDYEKDTIIKRAEKALSIACHKYKPDFARETRSSLTFLA